MATYSNPLEYTILAGGLAQTSDVDDSNDLYKVVGTAEITVDNTFVHSGTLFRGLTYKYDYQAVATYNGAVVSFHGVAMTATQALKNHLVIATYNGSAWEVQFIPDMSQEGIIEASKLASDAVSTIKIADLAVTTAKLEAGGAGVGVTNAKMAEMASATIKGNDSVGAAVPQDLSVTEVRTMLDQDVTLTGDVTGTATETFATGVTTIATTIANDAVTTAKIADDQITNAKMADGAITFSNLDSTGELESLTSSSPTPNSTALTVLASLAIPTGAMDTAGDVLEITAYGSTGATANNKTLTLVLGATTLGTNSTTAAPNNLNWTIEAKIFYTGAAAQKGYCKFTFSGVASEIDLFTGAETWLGNTIYIKGQNGTAAVGEITLEGFQVINHKKNNA